ncbi:hypothetical protein GCM10027568_11670 [Humibacter soli]
MAVSAAALALVLVGTPDPASAGASSSGSDGVVFRSIGRSAAFDVGPQAADKWTWPLLGARRVLRGFEAPASRYSAGHRGIDIAAGEGAVVVSPTAGAVHFAGVVVDRPTITIETRDGLLISMEPVRSDFKTGDSIAEGSAIGVVSTGGHCSSGCLHLGVRIDGQYVSPMLYFGGVPRAVLLPMR